MALPAVKENEVFSPTSSSDKSSHAPRPSISTSHSADSVSQLKPTSSVRDPSHHSPLGPKNFGYGPDCSHAGWMKKRQRTKMLRHEWQESHFRLKGTQLTQHANARLSSAALDSLNIDDYAVACSSINTNSKLTSAFKAFHLNSDAKKKEKDEASADSTAFAFQLIPSRQQESSPSSSSPPKKSVGLGGKTHHFAVKTKDDRIEWMRELMIAKALQQKGKEYEVEVNGVQA